MILIESEAHLFGAVPTSKMGNLGWIEAAGRVCYKSESKIKEGTAEPFVKKLITSGHLAMVEHSNFVIRANGKLAAMIQTPISYGRYLNFARTEDGSIYAGGNLTAWANYWKSLPLKKATPGTLAFFRPFIQEYGELFGFRADMVKGTHKDWHECPFEKIPPELHRFTMKFICDRGVTHELVRHRPCSFAQESTRYCDYNKGEMAFIIPWWWHKEKRDEEEIEVAALWISSMQASEALYKKWRSMGASPQKARAILPNSLKSEIAVTADLAEWAHIRRLRTAPDAHPDMRVLMSKVPWKELFGE